MKQKKNKKDKVQEVEQKKKNVVLDFFITTLNGMAYGLFATLIVATIIDTLAKYLLPETIEFTKNLSKIFRDGATFIKYLTGAGIGVGVALSLKCDTLKTIVLAAVGQLAGYFSLSTANIENLDFFQAGKAGSGDPLTIYLVVISVVLLIKLIFKKKTPVDILIIPLFGVILGVIAVLLIRVPTIFVTYGIQFVVDKATFAAPFIFGIIISVVMGMALTAPISSAAIAAIVFTGSGEGMMLASGAAVVGCCTQMVGFAIQSRKDNNIGTILSVGIGTSMLQFKNILKKPIIWLPTIIASAILGPISTCLFKIKCLGINAGMGTAGFVGVIGSFDSMGYSFTNFLIIVLMEIILPGALVFVIDLIFRKLKLIKPGDLKIND